MRFKLGYLCLQAVMPTFARCAYKVNILNLIRSLVLVCSLFCPSSLFIFGCPLLSTPVGLGVALIAMEKIKTLKSDKRRLNYHFKPAIKIKSNPTSNENRFVS